MTAVKIRGSVASSKSDFQENEVTQLSHDLEGLLCLEMSRDQDIFEEKPNFSRDAEKNKSVPLNFVGLDSFSALMNFIHEPEKYNQKIESFSQENLVKLLRSMFKIFEVFPSILEENYRLKNEVKKKIEADKLEVLEKCNMALAEMQEMERQSDLQAQEVEKSNKEVLARYEEFKAKCF